VVAIPEIVVKDIAWHLTCFTAPGDDALVFTSPAGGPLRHNNFRRRFWLPALSQAGLAGIHFHDLRHTGNNLTAAAGASLRELMDRMGHSSTRAALVYLHGSDARQHEIADGLSKLARAELNRSAGSFRGKPTGTRRARNPKQAS
jgi:integrase